MRFEAIGLDGAWLVHPERMQDSRGYFVRTFCVNEFGEHGLETGFPQHSVSSSSNKGTVRGMHFQRDPHGEVKLVRCLTGAIWDVIIDIRRESPTFRQSRGFELSGENGLQLYIPKGFAHGFQTLRDNTRVNYMISEFHVPGAADGIRYNEPAFDVKWPLPVTTIAEKDLSWPDFKA
jgi:dTDP-4-dehydrorhamnose 3,5-epimerase